MSVERLRIETIKELHGRLQPVYMGWLSLLEQTDEDDLTEEVKYCVENSSLAFIALVEELAKEAMLHGFDPKKDYTS